MPAEKMEMEKNAESSSNGEDFKVNTGNSNVQNFGERSPAVSSKDSENRGVLDLAKESGGQMADKALGTVKEKASSVVDEQKSNLAAGLGSIAGELRKTGENLRSADDKNQFANMGANYGEKIADKVDGLSRYLEQADLREMAGDLEGYARRNPAVFIGGAFLLGFAASRFIKSSGTPTHDRRFENVGDINTANTPQAQTQAGR